MQDPLKIKIVIHRVHDHVDVILKNDYSVQLGLDYMYMYVHSNTTCIAMHVFIQIVEFRNIINLRISCHANGYSRQNNDV